jgi:hypothetical protein
MEGVLQLDSKQNFTFNWSTTYVPFNTQAGGTTQTRNAISVGSPVDPTASTTYDGAGTAPSGGGLHLLLLDAGSLEFRDEFQIDSNCADSGGDRANCIKPITSRLSDAAADVGPTVAMIGSIGNPDNRLSPGGQNSPFAEAANALESFGANRYAFLGLDGTAADGSTTSGAGYGFVGTQGLLLLDGPNSGAELSEELMGSDSPMLAGLLTRNNQGLWVPGNNGTPIGVSGIPPAGAEQQVQSQLQQILATNPEPFEPVSDAEASVHQYLVRELKKQGITITFDPVYGIRAAYWLNADADWGGAATAIQDPTSIPPCDFDPCAAAYEGVVQELVPELNELKTVIPYFTGGSPSNQLQGIFSAASTSGAFDFQGILDNVEQVFAPRHESAGGPNVLAIIGDVLTIAGVAASIEVGPEAEGVTAEIPEYIDLAASGADLLGDTVNNDDGTPALDIGAFEADVYNFAGTFAGYFDVLTDKWGPVAAQAVSNAGRLSAAANQIGIPADNAPQPGTQPGWGFDMAGDDAVTLQNSISQTSAIYMYSVILPTVAQGIFCEPADGAPNDADAAYVKTTYEFENQSQGGGPLQQTGDNVDDAALFLAINRGNDSFQLPASIGKQSLFGLPPAGSGPSAATHAGSLSDLGALREYFISQSVADAMPGTPSPPAGGFAFAPSNTNTWSTFQFVGSDGNTTGEPCGPGA